MQRRQVRTGTLTDDPTRFNDCCRGNRVGRLRTCSFREKRHSTATHSIRPNGTYAGTTHPGGSSFALYNTAFDEKMSRGA